MDLLRDNLKKLYFKFLIPSLGSAMVMSIYTLTDAIVIGKGVGTDALAALSITTPLLCILMSTGILFGVGGSVQMSVHRGSGNTVKSNRYFTVSFMMIAAVTALLWILYVTCMPSLLRLMGANATLYPYAMSYMHYINIFLPVAVFSNFVAIFVRADNDPNPLCAGGYLAAISLYSHGRRPAGWSVQYRDGHCTGIPTEAGNQRSRTCLRNRYADPDTCRLITFSQQEE